jgi:hypothetical protein
VDNLMTKDESPVRETASVFPRLRLQDWLVAGFWTGDVV